MPKVNLKISPFGTNPPNMSTLKESKIYNKTTGEVYNSSDTTINLDENKEYSFSAEYIDSNNKKVSSPTITYKTNPKEIKELCRHCSVIAGQVYQLIPGTEYAFIPGKDDSTLFTVGLSLYFTIIKNDINDYSIKIRTYPELTEKIKHDLSGCAHMNTFNNSVTLRHINQDGSLTSPESVRTDSHENLGTWDGSEIILHNVGIITRGRHHIIIAGDRLCTDMNSHGGLDINDYITPKLGKPLDQTNCEKSIGSN